MGCFFWRGAVRLRSCGTTPRQFFGFAEKLVDLIGPRRRSVAKARKRKGGAKARENKECGGVVVDLIGPATPKRSEGAQKERRREGA